MIEVKAPYGRHRVDVLGEVPKESPVPTYYDLPAVKRSHYGWLIATYFFVGGLAGAAQLIAEIADLLGGRQERHVARWGRYLALVGSLLCPVLLIRDLHTSSRWYNMLRIFRPTSPMSIGSWTLTVFGMCSGLAALGQVLADLSADRTGRGLARLIGFPAALSGILMSVYTGVLLSATSTPLWATAYRHLPALFGATATASATAAISILLTLTGAPATVVHRLERLALVTGGSQLAITLSLRQLWDRERVGTPGRSTLLVIGTAGPLLLHVLHLLTGKRSRALAYLAAFATLSGALGERAEIVFSGNQSADRPTDYFHITSG